MKLSILLLLSSILLSFSASPGKRTAATDKAYIERFAPIAISEMRRYKIPASITLAQAILESNGGMSELARKHNNHFGVKCYEQHCEDGHCINYHDDTPKDHFKRYPSAWESFRDHSLFLQKSWYAPLYELPATDYKAWAEGLAKSGYAADKKYAQKLIKVIEKYDLAKYDAQGVKKSGKVRLMIGG